MITKREKLQYVYVFLTDLAALAASVILAWLIVGGIMGQLLPYSVLDWVQALVLLDRKSTRLNSSHPPESRMPSSA